ncbi:MAG TPA: ABC transporter ATP-binding protein [Candidatus Saccharimonadales bacterium]|nr:ABC transporter ATP-binding protein [Candidatus Saccharimonadales bacterium]
MSVRPEIRFLDVRRTYPGAAPVHALRGVTCEVAPGEFCLVQGPSGSGKTTLLAIAGGLEPPSSGRVWVGGEEISALRGRWLREFRRACVGFVFQDFKLVDVLTAEENVALGLELRGWPGRAARQRGRELLERLGLGARGRAGVRQLSGGEKQRVAVARALAGGPQVLLADEPTANLDWESAREVVALTREVARERGATVLAVSHDARLARFADRVLRLVDGRLEGMVARAERTTPTAPAGRREGAGHEPGA